MGTGRPKPLTEMPAPKEEATRWLEGLYQKHSPHCALRALQRLGEGGTAQQMLGYGIWISISLRNDRNLLAAV